MIFEHPLSLEGVQCLGFLDATTLTIASGVITVTQAYHKIDTESGAASDDLTTINGGRKGLVIYLCAADDGHTVVLKHDNTAGAGKIVTSDGNDYSLDDDNKVVSLLYDSEDSHWHMVGSAGGGGAGSDTTAIHDNVDGEIIAVAEKTTPVDADVFLTEDSASGNAKKRLSWTNIKATLKTYLDTLYSALGHSHTESDITDLDHDDTDAIHDNVTGEIAAVAAKATPVDADVILMEDSAAANAKKRLSWANIKATLKTYFDTLYSVLGHGHTESDISDLDHTDTAAVHDADFNAGTFLYAVNDDIPVVKTRAEVMALLSGQASADFAMNTHKITGVTDPTADQDASTKAYTDTKSIRYLEIRLLDKDTAHTVANGIGGEFRVPVAMTILDVGGYVDTAGTTSVTTLDINEAGTTILSTKITIDATEKSSETAATAAVISDSAIAADAILTFDMDAIASGTAGEGYVVWMKVKI